MSIYGGADPWSALSIPVGESEQVQFWKRDGNHFTFIRNSERGRSGLCAEDIGSGGSTCRSRRSVSEAGRWWSLPPASDLGMAVSSRSTRSDRVVRRCWTTRSTMPCSRVSKRWSSSSSAGLKPRFVNTSTTGAGSKVNISYVHQDLNAVPMGFVVTPGRRKPWGTGQAVLAAVPHLEVPFIVANADDFYGREAIASLDQFLEKPASDGLAHWAMVGYRLGDTLPPTGAVSRALCVQDTEGYLVGLEEVLAIEREGLDAVWWDAAEQEALPTARFIGIDEPVGIFERARPTPRARVQGVSRR